MHLAIDVDDQDSRLQQSPPGDCPLYYTTE
jgi:hypothetical protein